MQDPRIMQSMGVLMGIDMNMQTGPSSGSAAEDAEMENKMREEEEAREKREKEAAAKKKAEAEEKAKKEKEAEAKQSSPAQTEKQLGNNAYKSRQFDTALAHYEKAWELDSTDITFLDNKAAVLFEMGKYDDCIATCEEAVDKGRELRADYQLIARAFGRAGNAYMKKEEIDNAIKFYQKSMSEHRTPDIQAKLKEAEKEKEVRRQAALYSPEKAEEFRTAGNDFFKKDLFADAVKQYNQAIIHNPKDPRLYSNRAACFQKLMALPSALKGTLFFVPCWGQCHAELNCRLRNMPQSGPQICPCLHA